MTFTTPASMAEAKQRDYELTQAILTIEYQLSSRSRDEGWRARALRVLQIKKAERLFLKTWIKQRRSAVVSHDASGFENEAHAVLVEVRAALLKAMQQDYSEIGTAFNTVDQYLQHKA